MCPVTPNEYQVEGIARSLFGLDVDGLELTGEMVPQWRNLRRSDGTVKPVQVYVHPDPRVQAIVEQVREAETLQAIDRLRSVRSPKRVLILSSVVLDIDVDNCEVSRNLLGTDRLSRLLERSGGVVPLSGNDLVSLFPDEFKSVDGAKAFAKDVQRAIRGVFPNNILLGKTPLIQGSYQKHTSRGRPAGFVTTLEPDEVRSKLETLLGEKGLKSFKINLPDPTNDNTKDDTLVDNTCTGGPHA